MTTTGNGGRTVSAEEEPAPARRRPLPPWEECSTCGALVARYRLAHHHRWHYDLSARTRGGHPR